MHRTLRIALLAPLVLSAGCPAPPSTLDAGAPLDAGGTDAPAPDVRTGACVGDDECSDGSFCNGLERCDAAAVGADERGCAPSRGRPCLDAQICLEATDECETDCGADRDADDDGVDADNCPGGTDCDDADALRHPGLLEVCDAEDHDEDCDATTFGARDLDRDGAFDLRCCNEDSAGLRTCGDDCNDALRSVRPLGVEMCDGLDNDCNGLFDDGVTVPGFADADRDLHGDPGAATMACVGAVGVSSLDDDCDDARRDAHGAQVEICDGLDNDCDGDVDEHARPVTWYRDADGDGFGSAASGTMVSCAPLDGYSLLATDCDDTNRSRSPVAAEICDGLDDDCNGVADFWRAPGDGEDDDGDGHADAACGGDDCDDRDWSAYAGAPEICDHRDSDCDGLADQGIFPAATGAGSDTTEEVDWFADVDQDGWGAIGGAIHACAPQPGRVVRGGDCADADATRHPGAVDLCDALDDDCDASVDEDAPDLAFYVDADLDRDGDGVPTLACAPPPGLTIWPGDCAPADATRGPGLYESCNAIDDDCDGDIDETLFHDADGDGHGDPGAPVTGACAAGDTGRGDDCNDALPSLHPELAEACNLLDDDCDGAVDEAGAELCVAGADHGMCVAGSCEFVCAAGAADCDGDATNGCETALSTDPEHCGDCTTECGLSAVCGGMGGCDDPIIGVAIEPYHGCAWRRGGGVMCWGTNQYGALGVPGSTLNPTAPVEVPGILDAAGLCVGQHFTCALRRTGEVHCWGLADEGETGQGIQPTAHTPEHLRVPGLSDAEEVVCGINYVCARRATGRVMCWGGGYGTFGSAETGPQPREVPGMSDVVEIAINANTSPLYAVTTDGRLLSLGSEIGAGWGSTADLSVFFPGPVERAIPGGSQNGCALLRTSGELWCWGRNDRPQLWAGVTTSLSWVPASVDRSVWTGTSGHVIASADAMCALLGDGRVTCSGSAGPAGCLRGDGCALPTAAGTFVTGVDDAVSLAASASQFCAVRARGDVVCWGYGVLGDGSSNDRSVIPVRVLSD